MSDNSPAEIMEQAQQASPLEFPFGAFSGDLGGGAGAGVMFFHWHASPTQLLNTIAQVEPLVRDFSQSEADNFKQRFDEARLAGESLTAELLVEVNAILKASDSIIDWWGTFEELKSIRNEFCDDLRSQFRLHVRTSDSVEAGPLHDAEVAPFVDFIRAFGF